MICFGEVGGDQITLQGQTLKAQEAGTPLIFMGLPEGPRVTGGGSVGSVDGESQKSVPAQVENSSLQGKCGKSSPSS